MPTWRTLCEELTQYVKYAWTTASGFIRMKKNYNTNKGKGHPVRCRDWHGGRGGSCITVLRINLRSNGVGCQRHAPYVLTPGKSPHAQDHRTGLNVYVEEETSICRFFAVINLFNFCLVLWCWHGIKMGCFRRFGSTYYFHLQYRSM